MRNYVMKQENLLTAKRIRADNLPLRENILSPEDEVKLYTQSRNWSGHGLLKVPY